MAVRVKRGTKAAGASLREAINSKCKDCIFDDQYPGNWKEQVTACSSIDCPLWTVRPVTSGEAPSRLLFEALSEDIAEERVRRIWADPFDPSPWKEERRG